MCMQLSFFRVVFHISSVLHAVTVRSEPPLLGAFVLLFNYLKFLCVHLHINTFLLSFICSHINTKDLYF